MKIIWIIVSWKLQLPLDPEWKTTDHEVKTVLWYLHWYTSSQGLWLTDDAEHTNIKKK